MKADEYNRRTYLINWGDGQGMEVFAYINKPQVQSKDIKVKQRKIS